MVLFPNTMNLSSTELGKELIDITTGEIFRPNSQPYNFVKTRLQHKCFPVNIVKFLKTPLFNFEQISHIFLMLLLLTLNK